MALVTMALVTDTDTDRNFSRIKYSKTLDKTGLIAIALKSLHDIVLLRVFFGLGIGTI